MLIATILSQNTNDKNSHRAYTALRNKYPTWNTLARAPLRSIESTIRIGGMAHQKARRIKDIVRHLDQENGGVHLSELNAMRDDEVMDYLTGFKGVGAKTAACVLLFSLGRDVFPVDTHIHRICNRLGLASGVTLPEHTFEIMKPLVPAGQAYSLHTNLIRFGRRVCRANRPSCEICPLYHECVYEGKTRRRPRSTVASGTDHDFMVLDNV